MHEYKSIQVLSVHVVCSVTELGKHANACSNILYRYFSAEKSLDISFHQYNFGDIFNPDWIYSRHRQDADCDRRGRHLKAGIP